MQGVHRAQQAQVPADRKALRPWLCKLASGSALAQQVSDRLKERLPLHAIAAELAEIDYQICAETIYRACYDASKRSGLPPNS